MISNVQDFNDPVTIATLGVSCSFVNFGENSKERVEKQLDRQALGPGEGDVK